MVQGVSMILISNISPKLTSEPYVSYHNILCIFDYLEHTCKFHKYVGLVIDDHEDLTWAAWFSSGEAEKYFEMMDHRNK